MCRNNLSYQKLTLTPQVSSHQTVLERHSQWRFYFFTHVGHLHILECESLCCPPVRSHFTGFVLTPNNQSKITTCVAFTACRTFEFLSHKRPCSSQHMCISLMVNELFFHYRRAKNFTFASNSPAVKHQFNCLKNRCSCITNKAKPARILFTFIFAFSVLTENSNNQSLIAQFYFKQSYIPSLSPTGQSFSSIYKKEQKGQDNICIWWKILPCPYKNTYHSLFYFWSGGPWAEKECLTLCYFTKKNNIKELLENRAADVNVLL